MLLYIVLIILVLINGVLLFLFLRKNTSATPVDAVNWIARGLYDELKNELQQKNEALILANAELAKASERNAILNEEIDKLQEIFRSEFKLVANELLEEK